jgi:hypothetical protein
MVHGTIIVIIHVIHRFVSSLAVIPDPDPETTTTGESSCLVIIMIDDHDKQINYHDSKIGCLSFQSLCGHNWYLNLHPPLHKANSSASYLI